MQGLTKNWEASSLETSLRTGYRLRTSTIMYCCHVPAMARTHIQFYFLTGACTILQQAD